MTRGAGEIETAASTLVGLSNLVDRSKTVLSRKEDKATNRPNQARLLKAT